MNICVVSGELVNDGVVRGKDRNVLVFTVATKTQSGDSETTVSHVPCIIFNPPAELQQLLTTRGKDLAVEFQGKVNASRFDPSAEPHANGEVVVYTKTLRIGEAGTIPVLTRGAGAKRA
jgi:hypothetical protein